MFRLLLRLAAIALACNVGFSAAPQARTEHVFIISLDGGKPAAMHQSKMPNLNKLVAEGACTWVAETIRPSVTLPAHTSMLTGVPMETHHITWNDYLPRRGILTSVPTIFTIAKQAGLSTALFVGKEKFRHLVQTNSVDEFYFDQAVAFNVLKSDNGDKTVRTEGEILAYTVATNAANYILSHKPNLCFIHFADADTIGHEFGWDSPEQIKAFADIDRAFGVIQHAVQQAGVASQSVIIVSADHGGHGKGHGGGTPEDMHIPWIVWGQGVKTNFAITAPVNTCDTAATALWLLGLSSQAPITGRPVTSAFE